MILAVVRGAYQFLPQFQKKSQTLRARSEIINWENWARFFSRLPSKWQDLRENVQIQEFLLLVKEGVTRQSVYVNFL